MYKKLADQGDAQAQFNLGFLSERGQGTSTDYEAAESWYLQSAQQGYISAQTNLAWIYAYHKKDLVRGALWYEKAAAQRDSSAEAGLRSLYVSNPGLQEKVKKHLDAEAEAIKQVALNKQQELERKAQEEKQGQDSLACLDKLYDDSRTKSLAGKVLIDARKPASMELLANNSKPNAKDKVALSYAVAEWERCVDIQAEPRRKTLRPEIDQLINAYRLDLRSAFAELYGGKVSYGDLAKTRAKLDLDFNQKLYTLISTLQAKDLADAKQRQEAEAQRRYAEAQNQQQREAEQQRQQEARRQLDTQEAQMQLARQQAQQQQQNNNFLQNLQLLQMLNQPRSQPRPNVPVNCTSTRFGATVTTNCF